MAKKATSPPHRKRLLITGIAGGLATQLASAIPLDWEVVGIGRRPPQLPIRRDITYRQLDIRKKSLENLFRNERFDAVIHLAVANDARLPMAVRHTVNVIATMRLLACCERQGIPQVVLLSSADVYGADPTNPTFLTEDYPLKAIQRYADMGDKVEFDTYCRSWMHRSQSTTTTLLRPCHIVGPHVQNFLTTYLRFGVVPVPLGYDPMIQVIDERDMVQALLLVLEQKRSGVYNVTGPGELPLSAAIQEAGGLAIPVIYQMAAPLMKLGWTVGVLPFPTPQYDFLMFPCVIDGSKFRETFGFKPRFSLHKALRSIRRRLPITAETDEAEPVARRRRPRPARPPLTES
ncbi:MAG: NAD-dependent epimerase/dehydratase family protein [Chloracidobacterium sp.]|uniref:NAD-dependent epimerase/dehydratase family protein n=1 Tax=Chloracidobacterium validum TaxID=2821543 RepID=A0ABX8BD69_9BACT|nr:NAD-dependent epimerase/dehydratase family protein [Chloracidobacterium validum]QUW03790.1 NAD-dependent epimerase/dehydratase family protein [Chloracidobacterium validum]